MYTKAYKLGWSRGYEAGCYKEGWEEGNREYKEGYV